MDALLFVGFSGFSLGLGCGFWKFAGFWGLVVCVCVFVVFCCFWFGCFVYGLSCFVFVVWDLGVWDLGVRVMNLFA